MKRIGFRVTFTNELLGTYPTDPDTYVKYIMSRAKDVNDDVLKEVENIKRANEAISDKNGKNEEKEPPKTLTIFPRDSSMNLIMYDYQWRGYFKEVCSGLRAFFTQDSMGKVSNSDGFRNFKKGVDNAFFVYPREIPIHIPEDGKIGICARSLRANTPQGERIAIASSETIPAGSYVEFEVAVPDSILIEQDEDDGKKTKKKKGIDYKGALIEWMNYGRFKGMLQWRSGGKGTFTYECLYEKEF